MCREDGFILEILNERGGEGGRLFEGGDRTLWKEGV